MMSLKTVAAAAVLTTFNVKEVEDFVNGLLTGLVQDDSLTKVQACLKDAKSIETDMATAIADFQKGDIADIIAGAEVVGHLVQSVKADISDCEGMKDDATRIENWAKIFDNKSQLVQTILANSLSNMSGLKADIGHISTDVTNSDFKDLGMNIADIMTKTLGPVPKSAGFEISPKTVCAVECAAEAVGVFAACAATCYKNADAGMCIEERCDATQLAYELACTSQCGKAKEALTAPADEFPAFDGLHAHCGMQTTVSASCADVYAAFDKTVNTAKFDPAGGIYAVKQSTAGSNLWVTRTTPTKHYVDDIEFTLTGTNAICSVTAKSQSESLSYYDYDTNYCNMYNVFKSSGVTFTPVTTSECSWIPKPADLEATCNKY